MENFGYKERQPIFGYGYRNAYTKSSSIHYYAANGDLSGVRYNISKNKDCLNKIECGKTPLYEACRYNHVDIVKYLLTENADTEITEKATPLMIASEKNYREVASELLKCGAKVNAEDPARQTALHKAAKLGHVGIIHVLFKYKADPGITDNEGHTALSLAASNNRTEAVKLLLEHKVPVKVEDDKAKNPLIVAVEHGRTKVTDLLISAGAFKEVKNADRKTPLAIACTMKNVPLVTLLCEKGADVNAITNYENTPLHWAVKAGSPDVTKILLKYCPKLTRNEFGQTAADVAEEMKATDVVKLIRDYQDEPHKPRSLIGNKASMGKLEQTRPDRQAFVRLVDTDSKDKKSMVDSKREINPKAQKINFLELEKKLVGMLNNMERIALRATDVARDPSYKQMKVEVWTEVSEATAKMNALDLADPEKRDLEDSHLLAIAQVVGDRWEKLGRSLGVTVHDLNKIKHNNRGDPTYATWSMLVLWKHKAQGSMEEKQSRLRTAILDLEMPDLPQSMPDTAPTEILNRVKISDLELL